MSAVVNPGSAEGSREFSFNTGRQPKRLIPTASRPAGLRITAPFETSVWAGTLPYRVQRHGKTIFRVIEFQPNGFVISDQAPGLTIQGEVSYSDLPPKPQQPTPSQTETTRPNPQTQKPAEDQSPT
jgi:hypothetical protein